MPWIIYENRTPGKFRIPGVGEVEVGVPVEVPEQVAERLLPGRATRRGCPGMRLAREDEVPDAPPASAPPSPPRALSRTARVLQRLADRARARAQNQHPAAASGTKEV